MRIDRLELVRFGALSDRALDLSAGAQGLHVLHGDNEAGKSTTLRAVLALLFGVPERTGDAFLHDGKDLRIAARVRDDAGEVFEVLRRKGRKQTLLQADNKTPFDESRWTSLLAGVGRGLYTDAFGLSHETLRQGGEALLAGEGDLAQLLFGAGVGAARLRGLQVRIDSELEDLFKSRGSKPRINGLLRELKERTRELREATVAESAWRKAEEACERVRQVAGEADAALAEVERERSRLERLGRTAPLVAERGRLLEALDVFEGLPEVREDLAAERVRLDRELAAARQRAAKERSRLEEQRTDREAARLSTEEQALLDARPQVDELRGRLDAVRNALAALPSSVGSADESDAPAVEPEVVTLAIARLRELEQQQRHLEEQLGARQLEVEERDRGLETARERAAALGAARDVQALEDAVATHRGLAEAVAGLPARDAAAAAWAGRLAAGIRQLDGWEGDLPALVEARLPTVHEVKACGRDAAARASKDADRAAARSRLEQGVETAERELEALCRGEGVPSLEELEGSRRQRDALWARVRGRWLGEPVDEPDTVSSGGMAAGGGTPQGDPQLADAHRDATLQSDRLSDALRVGAEQVARRAQHEAALARDRAGLEELAAAETAARQEAGRAEEHWRGLWAGLPLRALGTPDEMDGWLDDAARLREEAGKLEAERAELDLLRDRSAAAAARLREVLEASGEQVAEGTDSLPALLERAAETLTRLRDLESRRAAAAKDLEHAESESTSAKARLEAVRREWSAFEDEWRAVCTQPSLAALELEEPGSPSEALARLGAAEARLRRAEHRRMVHGFERDVRRLVGRVAPDLENAPALDALDELSSRLAPLGERQQRGQLLEARLEDLEQSLEEHEATAAEAVEERARLLRPVAELATDEAALDALLLRLDERGALRSRLREVEQQLVAAGGGLALQQLVEEVGSEDPDRIAATSDRVTGERQRLSVVAREAHQQVALAERERARFDGNARAAELEAEAEELRAALADEARRYRTLSNARTLLSREIEDYRRTHQGPIVARASELFRILTLGQFQELEVDHGEADRAVLLAVRAEGEDTLRPALGGTRVEVTGLSDGTRDQLFLALKVATIETLIDEGRAPRLPVVLDDVLVHFDDSRSRAALEVLAELARKTQVLLFTHHGRVAEMARELAERSPPAGVFLATRS